MAYSVKPASIFGRVGTGIGKGLAEQIPKEMERNRLSSALTALGEQKGNTPFQNFAGLIGAAHEYPQVVQSGSDLLRQQSIIDSIKRQPESAPIGEYRPLNEPNEGPPRSATRPESTEAALNPYIPPPGAEQENMARQRMAAEPHVYQNLDQARQAVSNEILGNIQQSNAKLAKRDLEKSVQNDAESTLAKEIKTLGANVPGKAMSRLQQKAVDDVREKKLSPEEEAIKYGKEADKMSRTFADIASWGNMSLIGKNSKSLIQAMDATRKAAKEGGYSKEAADSMIADNGVTPRFAYASMYPVNEIKTLNDELKSIPRIDPRFKSVPGMVENSERIYRKLASVMGPEASPLSIAYELDKKGYDAEAWNKYLIENQDDLNLTSNQKQELQKAQPGFFGLLNDWWLKSFSGVR